MIYYDMKNGCVVGLGFYDDTPIDADMTNQNDKLVVKVKIGIREYMISLDWTDESNPSFRITNENERETRYAVYNDGDLHTTFMGTAYYDDNDSSLHLFKFGKIVAVVHISMGIYQIDFYDEKLVKM